MTFSTQTYTHTHLITIFFVVVADVVSFSHELVAIPFVPLFASLPSIENPKKDLVEKVLKKYGVKKEDDIEILKEEVGTIITPPSLLLDWVIRNFFLSPIRCPYSSYWTVMMKSRTRKISTHKSQSTQTRNGIPIA